MDHPSHLSDWIRGKINLFVLELLMMCTNKVIHSHSVPVENVMLRSDIEISGHGQSRTPTTKTSDGRDFYVYI